MKTSKRSLALADLTVSQVASELSLHTETVRRLLAQGDIPGYRAGGRWRVSRQQLDDFKASGGVKRPGRPKSEETVSQ